MSDVFFGLQVAVEAPPHDPWRLRLARAVRESVRDLRLADLRGVLGTTANLLLEAVPRTSFGFWDFVPDGKGEYDDWAKGIEDDSAETWQPDASGERMDHVLVSVLCLLHGGGSSALRVGERCDLPEATWTLRSTFRHLLGCLPLLDLGSVRSAAVFVTPGSERLAFTRRELTGAGYDYLLPLQ